MISKFCLPFIMLFICTGNAQAAGRCTTKFTDFGSSLSVELGGGTKDSESVFLEYNVGDAKKNYSVDSRMNKSVLATKDSCIISIDYKNKDLVFSMILTAPLNYTPGSGVNVTPTYKATYKGKDLSMLGSLSCTLLIDDYCQSNAKESQKNTTERNDPKVSNLEKKDTFAHPSETGNNSNTQNQAVIAK